MTDLPRSPHVTPGPQTDVRGNKVWRHNGLSIVVFGLFVLTVIGQSVAGWLSYNAEQQDHASSQAGYLAYLGTGHFWEALGENWESEFLQMAAFVILTACLFQKGSPESNDPDAGDEPETPLTAASPWPARRGGWWKRVYEQSLSIVLLALFAISFVIHAIAGRIEYNEEQAEHGKAAITTIDYVLGSRFWFESFQNWQSEFLSIGAMVVLGIFLRQKGSAESKPVNAPHSQNE